MIKKILICLMVIIIVFFIGYCNYKGIINTGDDEVKIPSQDTITKINIGIIPGTGSFDDYKISDKEDIGTIVDFLNSIHTAKIQDNSYAGGGYHLEFHTQDNQIVNIALVEPILTVEGKEWEVPYEKALEFDRIMADIIYKRYHNDATYDCLKGEVTELYNEDAHVKDARGFEILSRKRMCIIDTDNKKIDISYSYIFDFKKNEVFSGPKKGDQVEIYLKAGEGDAKAIFILNY
ncbi:MAG: hypothetical protein J1F02_11690 [Lachnospiraceae bacterium]|nr:hypothetical protein [Lachnospiraceae bacterium]